MAVRNKEKEERFSYALVASSDRFVPRNQEKRATNGRSAGRNINAGGNTAAPVAIAETMPPVAASEARMVSYAIKA